MIWIPPPSLIAEGSEAQRGGMDSKAQSWSKSFVPFLLVYVKECDALNTTIPYFMGPYHVTLLQSYSCGILASLV